MSSKKGVTLIALTTMMLLIVFLTGTLTYISMNSLELKNANQVRADLRVLDQKVEEYYLLTENLPVKGNGMTITLDETPTGGTISVTELPLEKLNKYDSGKYYLIDYEILDKIILNFSDRAYVINEGSHTIYALGGFFSSDGKEYTLPYISHINDIVEE